MKKIMYTRPDGGVSIIVPAPKLELEKVLGPLTDEEYRDTILSRSVPAGATDVKEIEDSDIPADRNLRDAWENTNGNIGVNVTKAQELIRTARNAKLVALDNKAVAEERKPTGDVAAINAEASRLRNIPTDDSRFVSGDATKLSELIEELK